LVLSATAWFAGERSGNSVRADECVVRVLAPSTATLTLDGKDQGAKREFFFGELDPLSSKLAAFVVTLPDNRIERREVLLLPGERVNLPVGGATAPLELVPQVGHPGGVTRLAFSPDGRYLFSGADGGAVLWDIESGQELRRFAPRSRRISSSLRFDTKIVGLAVSPDGRRLFASASDNCAYVWDANSGKLLNSNEGYTGDPSLALSKDGRLYALGSFAARGQDPVSISDTEKFGFVRSLAIREKEDTTVFIKGIGFAADGTKIVATGFTYNMPPKPQGNDLTKQVEAFKQSEHLLWVWQVSDGKLRKRIRAHEAQINALAMSPAGALAATASQDKSVAVWDLATGEPVKRFKLVGDANAVAFAPDGKTVLVASRGKDYHRTDLAIWNLASDAADRTISVEGEVACVAFVPDGSRFATGSSAGLIQLFDLKSGKPAREFRGRIFPVNSVAVTKDDRLLATCGAGGSAMVWDLERGVPTRLESSEKSRFKQMSWTADGKMVAACDYNTVAAWKADTGKLLWSKKLDGFSFDSLAYAPDGARILLGGKHGDEAILRFIDATDGKTDREVPVPEALKRSIRIDSVAYAGDGRLAAAAFLTGLGSNRSGPYVAPQRGAWTLDGALGSHTRTFMETQRESGGVIATAGHVAFGHHGSRLLVGAWELWDHQTGQKVSIVEGHLGQIQSVAFTPDGSRLLTASWDRTARLWDVAFGRELRALRGHSAEIEGCDISPDGRFALTGGRDGRVILWNIESGERIRTFQVDENWIYSVAFSPDGRSFIAGSHNGSAILWRTFSGYKERTFSENNSPVAAVEFTADGKRILAGLGNGTACVWERATGRNLMTLRGHTQHLSAVAVSPKGDRFLTGSNDRTVILWDALTGKAVRSLRWHSDHINHVVFSPDGQRILTTSWNNPAMMWDASSGSRIRTFNSSWAFGVPTAAFSPDGRRVVTGSLDRHAVIWDAETGERLQDFGAPVMATDVDASDNGRHVVVATRTGEIKLYDAGSGRKLRDFERQTASVNSVKFTTSGRFVLTAQEDGTTRVWDMATGDLLASMLMLDGGREWLAATPQGLYDGTPAAENAVAYRVGFGLDVRPPSRMSANYRYPGLLRSLLHGERPLPPN